MEWQYHPVVLLECVKQNETEALEDEFLSGFCHVRRWERCRGSQMCVQVSGMQQADTCRGTVL